ncbi:MAG: DUF4331 family protein [Candidatus Sericytochromatia bacterium]
MKRTMLALMAAAVLVGLGSGASYVTASDHDDGTNDVKTVNTNLTDLYVFTETSQNPAANEGDLIFILNTNPRSVARQQYFFNTGARYEFHVTRVSDNDNVPTGKDNVILRFEFGEPDDNNQQALTVSAVRDGSEIHTNETVGDDAILTTPLDDSPINNDIQLGGQNLTVFAGLREDPFFFDVEQYFRVRAEAAAGNAGGVIFRDPGLDFTAGYNVLSIVARVPRTFLQGSGNATSFDVWETISVKE